MLSRSDSAASTILKQSKSNASVKECVKHPFFSNSPDPDQSRIHALIAAHRAMDRSESRTTGDISRANSSASCRTAPAGTKDTHIQFVRAAQLRRPRSVLQARTPHLSAALKAHPQTRVVSLNAEAGCSDGGRVPENYGAEPSSYRKIRRTRSILTPRGRLFSDPKNIQQTPLSQAPTLRNSPKEPAAGEHGLRLRLKRSINALRPTSRLSIARRPETHFANHDAAVELAREQYFASLQENLINRPPPYISNPKTARLQQSLPKGTRTQQDQEAESVDNPKRHVRETSGSDSKMRSFSTTLQNHLRRAFGVSTSPKSAIPQQYSEPRMDQVTDGHNDDDDDDDDAHDTTHTHFIVGEEEEHSHNLYGSPKSQLISPEETDQFSPTLHCSVSGESMQSNEQSRVTSWTNSTATASSLSTIQPGLERNRLSIIKEDGGPHQPSSSAGRHFGGLKIFQEPLEKEGENRGRLAAVDSQRLYSALMKRIGEEEVEMEQTKVALDKINKGKNRSFQGLHESNRSTIRAVSNVSESTQFNTEVGQENVTLEDKHKSDRRLTNMAIQEEQSSFFPFSGQERSTTASPFRKLLRERRSQETTNESSTELVGGWKVDQNRNRCCSGQVTCNESIYSRTTDGGLNGDYQRPEASLDDLTTNPETIRDDVGMTPINPPRRSKTSDSRRRNTSSEHRVKVDKSGWIKDEITKFSLANPKTKQHRRERAQIDPDDVEVGTFNSGKADMKARTDNQLPLLEMKEVPRNNTAAPERSSSGSKSRTGLLKRISSIDLISVIGKGEENRKLSAGSRKYSPVNIARMIRERKSQVFLSREGRDKENTSGVKGDSPPISTPGRLQLQLRNGNGRLRKRRSEGSVSKEHEQSTPKSINMPPQSQSGECDESPTERIKQSLSARLSRPFDMDVPPENRPFDSVYLGKRSAGVPGERLSVAPNVGEVGASSHGYGGLGRSPFQADTALPVLETSNYDNEKVKGIWSSKRMVSDFLKRRRGGRSSSQETAAVFL